MRFLDWFLLKQTIDKNQDKCNYLFNAGFSIHFWWWWRDEHRELKMNTFGTYNKKLDEVNSTFCCWAAHNLLRRRNNTRKIIFLMGNFTMKAMIGRSRYNTITKRLIKIIVEWVISHPNAKPSFSSSDVVNILNS